MADDQVKYSDLIADDVVKGFELLNQVMKDLQSTMASLKTEATNVGSVIKGMGSANRDQQQEIARLAAEVERLKKQMKGLSDEEKKVTEIKRQYKKLTDGQIARVDKLASALSGLRTADEAQRKHALARINLINVENMSYNELQATYNALKDSLNAMTLAERQNTEAGKAMTAQSAKIYDTMNELQKATGKYTLQVGKYRAAFDGLGYSFQQILREAPSALNLNQFFLAISNNVPMFTDQLKAFRDEQKEIRANLAQMTKGTKEYAEQQEKVVSVGKKLGQVLISWQSLVLVGLMVLRNMDRIIAGINSLFSNLTKEQKMLKAVNEEAASSIGGMTAKYVALQKEWKNLKAEDMPGWLEQHKNDWSELGETIDDAKKAEDFYVNNTAAVQEAIDKRARSIAAMKIAAEKYEEAFNKEVEAENAVANRSASTWNRIKQILMGYSGAKYSWTRNYLEKTIKEDAEAYAEDMREEAKALREEATKLITTFVLPEESKPTGQKEKKGKEPKDQVADMLTLQRQLEDQIIANIENEYKRLDEEETKRHERFIQDQEAELAKLAENDPRRAVINQMIEEENRTHERKMEEIDEKRYQNLQALTKKRLDDEEKSAKEAERLAKEKIAQEEKDFKSHQEIDKRRFELTKHTAKEERKFVMQQQMEFLQWRIDNAKSLGISPELLEVMKQEYAQMQEMFNKGIYSTGKKNTYSSGMEVIADVLGFDIDSNQISALNSVFDQAKEALNSWMDARKAAADQAKELADDEVSAAENALNREIELRNQGYANNVALRERELADAKEKQKQAVEEQKKIAQQQILLDAALQTSSLITATANIIKQFPNPLVWGPMLATMWGSFAFAKIKAYQASTKSIQFREGGVMLLEGGSHESGHDVNLGIGPDGSNLRAEGGEYFAVINKRNSRKYGSEIPAVVNALNSGMFEDRYIKTSDAVGLLPRVIRADNGSEVDLSAVESGVGELVKQGESRWTVEGEYRVERYKNRVRRVKIS